jgi:hypothetical protein
MAKKQPARPEYLAFAAVLRAAMERLGLNSSEVARRVWGVTKDTRGYEVAKNRDRIGHYLAGASYPEPGNLVKLADVIGVPVAELAIDKPVAVAGQSRRFGLRLTRFADQPHLARLEMDLILPWRLAVEIADLVMQDGREGQVDE